MTPDAPDHTLVVEQVSGGMATATARVTKTAPQSIPNATIRTVSWDAVDWDDNTFFDAGQPTRLTALTAGLYLVQSSLRWDINAAGDRSHSVRRNGATYVAENNHPAAQSAAGETINPFGALVELDANDYLEIVCFQNSGGALNILASAADTWFSLVRLRSVVP